MHLLLTGATGFLGRSFAKIALNSGCTITALVRPGSQAEELEKMGLRITWGDLLDIPSLQMAMKDCEAVVHAASPHGGWRKPEVYQSGVIQATKNVLSAMKSEHVQKLVFVSTISVYGLDPVHGLIMDEESGYGRNFLPFDHYGRSKAIAEQIVQEQHAQGILSASILRLGWLYGPGDRRSYGLLAKRAQNRLIFRIGAGQNLIPLVYVENAARALQQSLEKGSNQQNTYLYASDGEITQNDYLNSLMRAARVSYPVPTFPKKLLLILTGINEHLAKMSNYRLPVLTTRYFIHLMGSSWRFAEQKSHERLALKSPVNYSEGLKKTEDWYQKIQFGEKYA